MLRKLLIDTAPWRPTHTAAIFDAGRKSFRNELHPDYKSGRPPTPEDLIPQFELVRRATAAFGVPCIDQEGFEADDLIAAYAARIDERDEARIVSSDKDLMQLVRPNVAMLDPMKERLIDADAVREKFGVDPSRTTHVQALAGDSVDNIPGVPGVGIKTAAALIQEHGDLETVLARAEEIRAPARRRALIEHADSARLSLRLATLADDMPLNVPLDDLVVSPPNAAELIGFLKGLEFRSLTRRVAADLNVDPDDIDPLNVRVADWNADPEAHDSPDAASTSRDAKNPSTPPSTPADGVAAARARVRGRPLSAENVEIVADPDVLRERVDALKDAERVGLDAEIEIVAPGEAMLSRLALCAAPDAAIVAVLAPTTSDESSLFAADPRADDERRRAAELEALLKPLLEAPDVLKTGWNLKPLRRTLAEADVTLAPLEDVQLLSAAFEGGAASHDLASLSERHLGVALPTFAANDSADSADSADSVDSASRRVAVRADAALRLGGVLSRSAIAEGAAEVYETLERPMIGVLADMERVGALVDRDALRTLSREFGQRLERLEAEIHHASGERFNIASPIELGRILFDRMGFSGVRRTSGGAWSTDAATLERLAAETESPLPSKALEWRRLSRLKSAYADSLPEFISPRTGRVHTSFSLAATSTGRLASSEPNLQNIPIRGDEGRKIRAAFRAPEGWRLASLDYSQIELRLLAHVADVEPLLAAFADDADVHAATAAEVFNLPLNEVDAASRSRAKAINFGIVYGISSFGLAAQLGISRRDAEDYINSYFERFPAVADYMERIKATCRRDGYVETLFGRRCHFPRIRSRSATERGGVERAAINAPIQGAAADLARRAMIRMPDALRAEGLRARMILQVHDELLFEVPDHEVDALIRVASRVMEAAAEPAAFLRVALKVTAASAENWLEAH